MNIKILYILPVIVAALLMAAAANVLIRGEDPSVIKTATHIPSPDTDIKGPAIINFFASWCVPCAAEHPVIKKIAAQTDIPVYGVNYMDNKDKAAAFFSRLGNPYDKVIYDEEGQMSVDWGLVGVPTTFIIDKDNMIIFRKDAPFDPEDITTEILPVLEGLQ